MTILVELPPELEERFLAQAKARGISAGVYVQELLTNSTQPAREQRQVSAVPAGVPPLSDGDEPREHLHPRTVVAALQILADTTVD